jgi:hypothetical protein
MRVFWLRLINRHSATSAIRRHNVREVSISHDVIILLDRFTEARQVKAKRPSDLRTGLGRRSLGRPSQQSPRQVAPLLP